MHDFIQNLVGRVLLAHQGQFLFALPGDEGNDIGISAETGAGSAQAVGADHVAVFLCKLRL